MPPGSKVLAMCENISRLVGSLLTVQIEVICNARISYSGFQIMPRIFIFRESENNLWFLSGQKSSYESAHLLKTFGHKQDFGLVLARQGFACYRLPIVYRPNIFRTVNEPRENGCSSSRASSSSVRIARYGTNVILYVSVRNLKSRISSGVPS